MGTEKKKNVIPLPWKPPYSTAVQTAMIETFCQVTGEDLELDPTSAYWYIEAKLLSEFARAVIPSEAYEGHEPWDAALRDDRFVPFEGGHFHALIGKEFIVFASEKALRAGQYILGESDVTPPPNDPEQYIFGEPD